MQGTPWEPVPGHEGVEIKSKVNMGTESDIVRSAEGIPRRRHVRRLYITPEDVRNAGMTLGCPGCRALSRGGKSMNHWESCRTRIEEYIQRNDEERYNRAIDRMGKELEKESKD